MQSSLLYVLGKEQFELLVEVELKMCIEPCKYVLVYRWIK